MDVGIISTTATRAKMVYFEDCMLLQSIQNFWGNILIYLNIFHLNISLHFQYFVLKVTQIIFNCLLIKLLKKLKLY